MESDQEMKALVQEAADDIMYTYIQTAAFSLLIYDTLLTMSAEIRFVWQKKFGLAVVLYSMARYIAITVNVLNYVLQSDLSLQSCTALLILLDSLDLLAIIGVQGLLIARTYAISGQSRWTLAVLFGLLLGSLIPAILATSLNTCDVSPSQVKKITLEGNISTAFSLVTDTAVILITAIYTIQIVKLSGGIFSKKRSLTSLLLHQGVLRYLFVLTVTLTSIVIQAILRPGIGSILIPIQNTLSSLIICRFLLEIRRRNEHINKVEGHPLSTRSFHAATRRLGDIVIGEFGDPIFSRSSDEAKSQEDVELRDRKKEDTLPVVNSSEYPWAVNADVVSID